MHIVALLNFNYKVGEHRITYRAMGHHAIYMIGDWDYIYIVICILQSMILLFYDSTIPLSRIVNDKQ